MTKSFVLLTRGQEIECANPIYRPAIEYPPLSGLCKTVIPSSLIADFPRRWKLARGCKVRTPKGDFIVTAIPQPDRTIRLDGKNIDAVAGALRVTR